MKPAEGFNRKKFYFLFGLIAVITVINYLPFLDLPFYTDDYFHIAYGREVTKEPLKILTIRTGERDLRVFPVLIWSLTYLLFKANPFAFHAVNLVFHLMSVLLWMHILHKITRDLNLSFFASLLYAVYFPTAIVAIVPTCMIELCYMLFGLLSFLYYIKYAEARKKVFYYASLLFFLCAIFSKEAAMSFVAIFILYRLFISGLESKKSLIGEFLKFIPYFMIILINSYLALISPVMSALVDLNGFHVKFLRLYSYLFLVVPAVGVSKTLMGIDPSPLRQSVEITTVTLVYCVFSVLLVFSLFYYLYRRQLNKLRTMVFFLSCTIVPLIPVSASMYIRKDFAAMPGWSWYVYIPSIFFTALVYLILRDIIFEIGTFTPKPLKYLILFFPIALNIFLSQTYGKEVAYAPERDWTCVFDAIKEECKEIGENTNLFVFGKIGRFVPPTIKVLCDKEIKTKMVLSKHDPRARRLKPLSGFMDKNDPRLKKIKPVQSVIHYEDFVKKLNTIERFKVSYFFDSSIIDITSAFEDKSLLAEKNLLILGINKNEGEQKLFCVINGRNHERPDAEFWFSKIDEKTGDILAELAVDDLQELESQQKELMFPGNQDEEGLYFMISSPNSGSPIPEAIERYFLLRNIQLDEMGIKDNLVIIFRKTLGWEILMVGTISPSVSFTYLFL